MMARAANAVAWVIVVACVAALVAFALSPLAVMALIIAGQR